MADKNKKAKQKGHSVKSPVFAFPKPHVDLKQMLAWRLSAASLIVILLSFLAGYAGGLVSSHRSQGVFDGTSLTDQKKIVTSQSQLISRIAKSVGPSVVSVNVDITSEQQVVDPLGMFAEPQSQTEKAAGTGIIISDKGLIMTNRHV